MGNWFELVIDLACLAAFAWINIDGWKKFKRDHDLDN